MMDFEKTFSEEKIFYRNRIESLLDNFKKNNINGFYADNKEEALSLAKVFIENNKGDGIIGIGDSMSLHQINLFEYLYSKENNYTIYNTFERLDDGRFSEFKNQPNDWIPTELYNKLNRQVWEKSRKAMLSDLFITSANAVTIDGKIVSVDGVGNRIASVIYGPYKVLLIVGRNKIVENVDEAISKIKNLTTPLNHLRHATKHCIKGEKAKDYGVYKLGELPCVKKGHCIDCNSPLCSRHCLMVMERATGGMFKNRINVIVVNENLGL